MDRWSGRVALVTGASVGIGAAICRELVGHGMTVVGCARSVHLVQSIAQELEGNASGKLVPIKCDLTKEEEILQMFAEIRKNFGRLDVCVNNAGLGNNAPLLDSETRLWREMLDVNVMALCICTREAVKLMREKNIDDGHIVHISSIGGHRLSPMPGIGFYCGTKFMVRALTDGLRHELKRTGTHIRISSISPGVVETQFLTNYMQNEGEAKKYYDSLHGLSGKDVADAVVFVLASPAHVEVHDIIVRPVDQQN